MTKTSLRKLHRQVCTSKLVSDDSPMLAQIVVDASKQISESSTDGKTLKVDLDNIKVEKKAGASIHDTKLIKGIVLDKEVVTPECQRR